MQGFYSIFQSFPGFRPFRGAATRAELDRLLDREDPATLAAYGKRFAASPAKDDAAKAA